MSMTDPTAPHPGVPTPPVTTNPPGVPATAPTSRVMFGVALTINNKPVLVTTDDVANIREKGIEFTLPDPVELGTINDARHFLQTEYGVSTEFLDQLPGPLKDVANRLTSLDFTVQKLHVKVPPGTAPTQYTLAMSAMWPNGTGIHVGSSMVIDGVVFGVTNEPQLPAGAGADPALAPGAAPGTTTPAAPHVPEVQHAG